MSVTRGGKKGAFKQRGRKRADKCFQAVMRQRAVAGRSHDAGGNQIPTCSPDSNSPAGKMLYYGYHLQDKK